jgi:hypothetical protein
MKDLTKLRKISDDLYVEDYESKDGAKRQFKYEREFDLNEFFAATGTSRRAQRAQRV